MNQESGTCWVRLDPTMQFGTSSSAKEWSDNFKAFCKHQPTSVFKKCSSAIMVSWIRNFQHFFFLYYSFIFSLEARLNHRQHTQWRLKLHRTQLPSDNITLKRGEKYKALNCHRMLRLNKQLVASSLRTEDQLNRQARITFQRYPRYIMYVLMCWHSC